MNLPMFDELRDMIRAAPVSLGYIAKLAGITPSGLSHLLHERTSCLYDTAQKLLGALGKIDAMTPEEISAVNNARGSRDVAADDPEAVSVRADLDRLGMSAADISAATGVTHKTALSFMRSRARVARKTLRLLRAVVENHKQTA